MQSDWNQVLFTDESRHCLECDTRRLFVWQERSPLNNPIFVQGRSRYRRGVLMVRVGISIIGFFDLHIIRNDNLLAQKLTDKTKRLNVVPEAAIIGDSFF
ncbi:hypothetical protein TNCV_1114791 [Trichonephila clavipes]|nr:hypothetical protein TNCV_1114791 [Trichonephila clavipes]